jgi:hypothetical protein
LLALTHIKVVPYVPRKEKIMVRVAPKLLSLTVVTLWLAGPLNAQTGFTNSQTLQTSGASDLEVLVIEETMGVLTGVVLQDVSCASPAESSVEGIAGTLIEVLGETFSASAVTDASGSYQVTIPQGTYQIQATAPTGQSAVESSDVLVGSVVHMNFTLDSADDTLLPSRGATLVVAGDPNPDVDANGIVDFADLEAVTANEGVTAAVAEGELTGDLNADGIVDAADIQIVEAAFGRTVLNTANYYQAEVTPGGSMAVLGGGLGTVESGDGYTMGRLEPTGDPAVGRFVVDEDRGTATSPELGDFTFDENSADPSFILFEVDTGRVVGGRMTLLLNGGPFSTTYSVDSLIPEGIVTFAPGGFERYHMVDVNGTLSSLPVLGTVAMSMCKKEKKKKDKACATVAATCGRKCAVNATCAKNGKCGTCRTVRIRKYRPDGRLYSDRCWCECQ